MSLDPLPQSKELNPDPDSPQRLTLDRRSLPTEDRAVNIEIPDLKFPAFLRQSSAGRTTDWFQTSLTGEYILYNRTESKQSECQWFEIWIAHWAKQQKLDLKRRRLCADSSIYRFWFYDGRNTASSYSSRALWELSSSFGLRKMVIKTRSFISQARSDQVTYSRWVADPNCCGRSRFRWRWSRRVVVDQRKGR